MQARSLPSDNEHHCPLCDAQESDAFWSGHCRDYLRCGLCGLVFVPAEQHLSGEAEKRRYDLHRNDFVDAGYRRFLSRLGLPLQERISSGSRGLDFGSGPEPVLARMFEDAGHTMTLFDLFYQNEPAALEQQYDFITMCEVIEHLREPRQELNRLWACLRSGGWLGIMTRFCVDQAAFPAWHYKNDRTHISFFARETFAWLASEWNVNPVMPEDDVVLFRKGTTAGPA